MDRTNHELCRTLLNGLKDNENPEPVDLLSTDAEGNIKAAPLAVSTTMTTTTTNRTTTPTYAIPPTEPIVLKPTTTRIALGLKDPFVARATNADELAGVWCASSTESYARGCHWFPRLLA